MVSVLPVPAPGDDQQRTALHALALGDGLAKGHGPALWGVEGGERIGAMP